MDWIPIILSIVATAVSVGALFREWRFGKPDALQKYEKVVTDILKRIEDLEAENETLAAKNKRLEARQNELESENQALRLGVVILVNQMREAGMTPKWQPQEDKQ